MDDINNCYRRACRITILTKSIIISNSDVKALIEHAKSEDPKESCALLIGSETDEEWNVKDIFVTRNSSTNSEQTFGISPEELLQGYKLAEEKHLELFFSQLFYWFIYNKCCYHPWMYNTHVLIHA